MASGLVLFVWYQTYFETPGYKLGMHDIESFYKDRRLKLHPRYLLLVMLVSLVCMVLGSVISFMAMLHLH